MAKRRNLKKEKASRNQAYARQFRKKSTRTFSGSRRYSRSENNGAAGNGNDSGSDSE